MQHFPFMSVKNNKASKALSDLADEQLVTQAQRGSQAAFGELHHRYALMVFRFLYGRTGNIQDAEDLTSEVFVRAWEALPRYRQQGVSFGAYLMRIARNLAIDLYRKNQRDLEQIQKLGGESNVLGYSLSPEEVLINRQESDEMFAALSKLKPDYRDVLLLRFVAGLSTLETARVIGRTHGSTRVLQHRALHALRALLVGGDRAR